MRSSCHNSHIFAYYHGAAAESDEDLAHDNIANPLRWLPEVDHESHTEEVETHHGKGEILEAT
jgi:hypothetical protein